MAVLAFGVIGSAIGSGFAGIAALGLSGSAIGWTAGTLLGNALFTKGTNTTGPRIGDLKIQASTYGTFIPVVYGTHRLNGNIIFCQGLDEHTHTQKVGKGGGAKSTTYTYTTDVAILLCRGEMAGIRKIWNNGKLIYDISAAGDPGVVIASALNASNFIFYPGSQTQMPDPTMEARMGVGNVPAYLGCCYVMFTGLDCPNGQIPQLSFEVVELADASQTNTDIETFNATVPFSYDNGGFISSRGFLDYYAGKEASGMPKNIYRRRGGPGYVATLPTLQIAFPDGSGLSSNTPTPVAVTGSGGDLMVIMPVSSADAASLTYTIRLYNIATGALTVGPKFTFSTGGGSQNQLYLQAAYDPILDVYVTLSLTATPGMLVFNKTNVVSSFSVPTAPGPMAAYDGVLYVLSSSNFVLVDIATGAVLDTYVQPTNGAVGGTNYTLVRAGVEGVYFLSINSGGQGKIWKFEDGTFEELATGIGTGFTGGLFDGFKEFYSNDTYGIIGPVQTSTTVTYRMIQYNGIDPALRDVSDVIVQISEESGFDSAQVNTLGIPDQLWGFMRTRQTSGRALLDPILSAYSIDPVDNGDVIDYLKRQDQTVIATIAYDELGAGSGGDANDDPFPFARSQQDELPRSITTNFINQDADYETGAEVARRNIVDTQYDDSFEMPIATTADHAATISNILLYEAWNERNTRSTSLTQKYVYLNTADLVSIEWPRDYFSPWRIVKLTNDGVVIKVDLVPADPELYSGQIVGTTPAGGQTVDNPPTPTNLVPLDIPILRDADNDAGEYVAMDGYGTNWPGAVLLKGDDDINLSEEGTLTVGAGIGFIETALGAWAPNILDYVNSVTVQMIGADDTLASVSRDAMYDSDANLFAIGVQGRWEICQAMTVVSLGGGRFTLSNWLRGQRGTEQFASTHAAFDSLVYIAPSGAGLLRPQFDLGELNTTIYYKGVTLGDNPDEVEATTTTNTGVGLKPFNPVNLRALRDGTNTTITWDRRTRLIVDSFADGTDIPLGESSEQYRVIFYTDNTFSTIASTQTVYTASVVDAGTGTKYVDIAQVSALTGPGFYTRATL